MRIARQYESRLFRGLKLPRECVVEIVRVLTEHCERIEMQVAGFYLDDIAELAELKKPPLARFAISGYSATGHVSVSTDGKDMLQLNASNTDDVTVLGVYKTIEAMLASEVRNGWIPSPELGWTLLIVGGSGAAIMLDAGLFVGKGVRAVLLDAGLLAVGVAVVGWLCASPYRRFACGICLARPERGFWARNKHRIALLAIGAALTIVAGLVLRAVGAAP